MPLIHIHLVKGKSPKYIQAVCDGIHNALKTAWRIPENDRFQIVSEHKKEHFYFDKTIWGVKRSDDLILINITSILTHFVYGLHFRDRHSDSDNPT